MCYKKRAQFETPKQQGSNPYWTYSIGHNFVYRIEIVAHPGLVLDK
jgi:hypothetical protein